MASQRPQATEAAGLVRITGPMTKEEKVVWDKFREQKTECDQTISELKDLLEQQPDYAYRAAVLEDIAHETKIRSIISRAIPGLSGPLGSYGRPNRGRCRDWPASYRTRNVRSDAKRTFVNGSL